MISKVARERLEQNPANSSVPPSSRAPWDRGSGDSEGDDGPSDAKIPPAAPEAPASDSAPPPTQDDVGDGADNPAPSSVNASGATEDPPKRKPGKQPGAPGVGRSARLQATHVEDHRPSHCHGCGLAFPAGAPSVMHNGFQSIDLVPGGPEAPGLHLKIIDHRYFETTCACGHCTRAMPNALEVPGWEGTTLSEWRITAGVAGVAGQLEGTTLSEWRPGQIGVAPGLVSFIVALKQDYRCPVRIIRRFLHDWLGIPLAIGTIQQALQEAGAAVAPAEESLIADLAASDLQHADETPWPQQGEKSRWLWVFLSATTTLFVIAGRGKDTVSRVLALFTGHLMSDGWFSYRDYPHRLRCWAHLLRKAQGLIESYDADGQLFGAYVLGTLKILMAAVFAARDGPPEAPGDLPAIHAERLQRLKEACRLRLGHGHKKTRALAVELMNDWEAIFRVLHNPHLPLTNNAAERALRHWVIARRIFFGTRTKLGSDAFTILASVIETCRQRNYSPWTYLTDAITERRAGRALPPLPQLAV